MISQEDDDDDDDDNDDDDDDDDEDELFCGIDDPQKALIFISNGE